MSLRALSCSLVLVLVVGAALSADDPPEYSLAVQLVQEERWGEALEHIQNLLQQYPGNPKVGNLEGLALLGRGDTSDAVAAFERVLIAHPDFFPSVKNLAILEWETKNPRAPKHTAQALKIEPKDPTLNAYAALSELQQKKASVASHYLDLAGSAISAMPPELEMRLAYLLATSGAYPGAARVYQDIVAHGGRSPTLTYNLGLAQYLAGNYEDAIHTLEDAGPQGKSRDELNLLAQAYEKNHQTQLAIDRLREAITRYPSDENNYLDLATICMDHNAYPLGIQIVQLGLRSNPKSKKLLFQLGVLQALAGQFDAAREEFRRVRKLAPGQDLPVAALELADIQQNEETIQELRRNLKEKGDSAILSYLLGSSLVRRGAQPGTPEYAEARRCFQRAIQLDPRLPYPYIELGKMYEQQGKIPEAISLFEKVTALGFRDAAPYYHLARDYQKLNQTQKATQMLKRVKEIERQSREFEQVGLTAPDA
jgi:tetratricopeptide (TPR) repeat protein